MCAAHIFYKLLINKRRGVSHHICLRLVLHGDHPDENLIALNLKAAFDITDIVIFIIVAQQRI